MGALGVGDHSQVDILKIGSHTTGGVTGASPSGGDSDVTDEGRVGVGDAWQLDGGDPAAGGGGGDLDQGDVVAQVSAVPAGVDDDVGAGHGVGDLGGGAHGGAQVDGHGLNSAINQTYNWLGHWFQDIFGIPSRDTHPSVQ